MAEATHPGWSVVTGANRGLGLEFTRQLLAQGHRVAACCRTPADATALHELQTEFGERLRVVALDVSDTGSRKEAVRALLALPGGIALQIHNAGIFAQSENGLAGFNEDEMLRVFRVNLYGPIDLTRLLLPALERAGQARVFILTSRTGALRPPPSLGNPGSQFTYGCSKAAVHRLVPLLAGDLKPRGIVVGGVDPGWVRTDMTSGAPPKDRFLLEPETSVAGMLKVMASASLDSTGTLWRWNGEVSRWYAPEETADERQEVTTVS